MGGIVSKEDATLVYITQDGSITITEEFARGYQADMPFDLKRPVVTRAHEALIHEHWAAVAQGTSAFESDKHVTPTKFFYSTFYSKLFQAVPAARALFRSSMTVQGKAITGMISTLATVMRSGDIVEMAQSLATAHAAFGATKDHYTAVGIVLLETLETISGPNWNEDIKTAYYTAYCFLYYLMLPVILGTTPATIEASIPGRVTAVTPSATACLVSIRVDFPLRYHAGDAVVLGTSLPTGDVTGTFPIVSVYNSGVPFFEVCVSPTVAPWLAEAPMDSVIRVFWVVSGVHFELDAPASIPTKLLFVSDGIHGAPFLAMVKGLHALGDAFVGDAIWLQCGLEPIPCFRRPLEGLANTTSSCANCETFFATTVSGDELLIAAPDIEARHLFVAGAASLEDTSMVYVDDDGSVGIRDNFRVLLAPDMGMSIKEPIVTPKHEALMRSHWAIVVKGTEAFDREKHVTPTKFFYTTFYSLLFEASPSIRPMFRSSMTFQGRMLTGVIGALATATHADNGIFNIQQLAVNHAKYGATNEHYITLGETLLQTLAIVSGSAWTEAIKIAYLNAYCLYYYIMLPVILDTPPAHIKTSLRALVTAKEMLADDIARITITVDFPLRYHPGDAVLLHLPMPSGDERRAYAITSLCEDARGTFEICVQSSSASSSWLVDAEVNAAVGVYWIMAGLHFETDTPATLPRKPLFVSEGIGAAPFLAMVKGLRSVLGDMEGDVVWLQVAPAPVEYFTNPWATRWDRCGIFADSAVTQSGLLAIAPDLAERHLYVAGSATFIETTKELFVAAGGAQYDVYSFDNNVKSPHTI
ncbi:hypothetical protein ACHHYP_03065 [Achlya hypogyna]|uniref:nitric oxide dioxygenase n=1 Tax=Achlya hypogyna TaxID=1202772 RepID=A0A1V9Z4F6_ACHHY|nr:hypothetical protein ACHHYP_03065 [Achlya hypogyna]